MHFAWGSTGFAYVIPRIFRPRKRRLQSISTPVQKSYSSVTSTSLDDVSPGSKMDIVTVSPLEASPIALQ